MEVYYTILNFSIANIFITKKWSHETRISMSISLKCATNILKYVNLRLVHYIPFSAVLHTRCVYVKYNSVFRLKYLSK
jgi:hypothetical protein